MFWGNGQVIASDVTSQNNVTATKSLTLGSVNTIADVPGILQGAPGFDLMIRSGTSIGDTGLGLTCSNDTATSYEPCSFESSALGLNAYTNNPVQIGSGTNSVYLCSGGTFDAQVLFGSNAASKCIGGGGTATATALRF